MESFSLDNITTNILQKVQKPSRYLGTEIGTVHKNLQEIDLHFCLSFPSLYEIGMSFTGFQILYQMINNHSSFFAERAYLPDCDFSKILRDENIPLFSLESKTPLKNFDIIGFSLQYELSILGILEILDLSKIPLLAKDRTEEFPLIFAGGPLCYNPLPFSDFIDVFFIGDAEDTYINLLEIVANLKKHHANKNKILKTISKLDGVFVPKIFNEKSKIKRQIAKNFDNIPSFNNPIIPFCEIVHNRLAIEIQRGCTRGCRFCQAGFLYRPLREKSLQQNFENIISSIKNTGFEEVSLLSLSTADYSKIIELLDLLKPCLAPHNETTISFPSTRVDKLQKEFLSHVQESNRKSFTIAPEGGSQRIRNIINKGITEEQIFEACKNAFSLGWNSLKMYFMIGLPFETDEDILEISDLALKIKKQFKGKHIVISVSTFIPKSHTPFERALQISEEETFRRQELLFSNLRKNHIDYRFNKAFASSLEGLIARGDNNLTNLFLEVFKNYPKGEIAKEFINKNIWEEALKKCDISLEYYLRKRSDCESLPWKIIDTGLDEKFLSDEYKKAKEEKLTLDCKNNKCNDCGICKNFSIKNILKKNIDFKLPSNFQTPIKSIIKKDATLEYDYRLKYKKANSFRLLSYLEIMNVFIRALRRTNLPLIYTKGFTPRINFRFGPPLQLGIESYSELLDLKLSSDFMENDILEILNNQLPNDLDILNVEKITSKTPSIQSRIKAITYVVTGFKSDLKINENWQDTLISKTQNKKTSQIPIEKFLELLEASNNLLRFKTLFFNEASIKPKDAFFYLTGCKLEDYRTVKEETLFNL